MIAPPMRMFFSERKYAPIVVKMTLRGTPTASTKSVVLVAGRDVAVGEHALVGVHRVGLERRPQRAHILHQLVAIAERGDHHEIHGIKGGEGEQQKKDHVRHAETRDSLLLLS